MAKSSSRPRIHSDPTPYRGRGAARRRPPRWLVPVAAAVVMVPLLFLSVAFAIGIGTYSSSPVVTNASHSEQVKFKLMIVLPLVAAALSVAAWGVLVFQQRLRAQIIFAVVAVVLAAATPASWIPLRLI